jgi:hypothetical protein
MSTYYVDPAATGAADGSSWTDAWTSLQTAADTAEAGDTVYCRGTQTLAAAIDFDTNSGSDASGYIKFIGCNASGTNDGTYFVLDGDSTSANGIVVGAVSMVWLENIKVQNCTNSGIDNSYSNADYWMLINVWITANGSYGIDSVLVFRYWTLWRCVITNNSSGGTYRMVRTRFVECRVQGNTGYGVKANQESDVFSGCLLVDNDANSGTLQTFLSCVIDSHATKAISGGSQCLLVGCRVTGNAIGLEATGSTRAALACCYFGGNTTDIDGSAYDAMPIDGSTSHVVTGGADTDDGYVDSASDDYNLASDATLRSFAVELP